MENVYTDYNRPEGNPPKKNYDRADNQERHIVRFLDRKITIWLNAKCIRSTLHSNKTITSLKIRDSIVRLRVVTCVYVYETSINDRPFI